MMTVSGGVMSPAFLVWGLSLALMVISCSADIPISPSAMLRRQLQRLARLCPVVLPVWFDSAVEIVLAEGETSCDDHPDPHESPCGKVAQLLHGTQHIARLPTDFPHGKPPEQQVYCGQQQA